MVLPASEKAIAILEMELAKSQKEIDSLNSQHSYIEKQLDSLEAASQPRKDELDRLEELKKIISTEDKEIDKLIQGYKELKEKALELQNNIENTGGERLKAQKLKLIDEHKDALDNAKSNYDKVKNTVDELRASEVDAEYKLPDMKKAYKELQLKAKGYKKRLDDLQTALIKHMEQYVLFVEVLRSKGYRTKVSLYNGQVEELNKFSVNWIWYNNRLNEFMAGFNAISLKLKEMYQMITLGGDAELEPVDSLYPFSEGVVFSVRLPRKSWKNIANLSGGEKTLNSLALVCALHHYKPTPLYVMDEIDAALGTFLNP
ncbi:hypothetical protein SO802_029085 [Lithocarpus litseifolius]|uniref:RecF/RecN/SMC N-terminal domain-containing protein n=1 Tax=Lithocarpus litseifolius TaxID=425828 RepID=A0AAW2BS81_9ROSI